MPATKLDEESYNKEFKPALMEAGIDAKSIININIPQDEFIPISDAVILTFRIDSNNIVSFVFHHTEVEGSKLTELEIILFTTTQLNIIRDRENHTSLELSKLAVDKYDLLLDALTIQTKRSFKRLKFNQIGPVVDLRTIGISDWDCMDGSYINILAVPSDHPLLTIPDVETVTNICSSLIREDNPFLACEKISIRSIDELNKENYDLSVMFAQLSIETFFWELLSKLQNKSKAELFIEYETKGFISMLKSSFCEQLKGNWDVKNENTEIGIWYKNSYNLRNEVIHAGKQPTFGEADLAIESMIVFKSYVVSLIKKRPKKLKEIQKYFN